MKNYYEKNLARLGLPRELRKKKVLFYKMMKERGGKMFIKRHLVLCSFARTINPCNHITPEWDGA